MVMLCCTKAKWFSKGLKDIQIVSGYKDIHLDVGYNMVYGCLSLYENIRKSVMFFVSTFNNVVIV